MIQLKEAGINLWMLTGDKLETAKCIAISTGFKNINQLFFDIITTDAEYMRKQLLHYNPLNHVIVISGDSLEVLMNNEGLRNKFFKIT